MPRSASNEKAMLRSQSGPGAGTLSNFSCRIAPHLFLVLFLRRFHLPSLLSLEPVDVAETDVLGHHLAACARAGVLGGGVLFSRALPPECARVSTNVLVRHRT